MATIGQLVVTLQADSAAFTVGMEKARASTQRMEAELKRFQREGLDRMAAGMTYAASGASKFEAGLRNLGSTTNAVATSVARTDPLFLKLRGSLTAVAVSASGASGPVGTLISVLATAAAGGGPVVLATAAFAGLAFAYRRLTEDTRNARAATDELIESLNKAAGARANAADPSTSVRSAFAGDDKSEGITNRMARLNRELESARRGTALADRSGNAHFAVDDAKVKRLEAEIKRVASAAWEVGQQYLDATSKAEAFNGAATAGAKRHADMLDRVIEKQRELQSNMTQGMGGTDTGLPLTGGGLTHGATRDEITNSRGTQVAQRLEEEAAAREQWMDNEDSSAALWNETWINSIRGTQMAFADFFANIGQGGLQMQGILEGVAKSIQRAFAEMLAQQLIMKVLGSIFGGGIPGAPDMGNIGDSLEGIPVFHRGGIVGQGGGATRLMDPAAFLYAPRFHRGGMIGPDETAAILQKGETVLPKGEGGGGRGQSQNVTVNQNITVNASAVDQTGMAQLLMSQRGVIASIVAQAAADAPSFAKSIVGNASR